MKKNTIRAAAAAVALGPVIVLGSGVATASPAPVHVADHPAPISTHVEPAMLSMYAPLWVGVCANPAIPIFASMICAA
ncbi:hypothetical protein OHA40_06855 [Nocardia sp. NBC_00508]|uniref:hypothetical protein n=1 Tax=Nocardia sp. NBC_00508 TaxID=2975992 RepID=UPI002E7FECBE|nr:hypothetical protein [Nocardia sp. NBC_00508]WUD67840.1 hypothetical protein OHA40_06855 [Nocardia sp. NBC_00508]